MRHCRKGFTLIEIIITLGVVSVLAGVIVPMSYRITNMERVNRTLDELDALAMAIIGNPVIVYNEARTNFGYVGDMGNLPSSIEDLYKKGGQPDFYFDIAKEVGAGWSGPYISPEIVEYMDYLQVDPFGNDYDYSTIPYTDTTVGAVVEGYIKSPGEGDGTSDDLSLLFFSSQLRSKVSGVVKNEAVDGVGGVTVTMNYPSNGVLTTSTTLTDGYGFYTFDDIPYGNRSVTLSPNLVVTAGSAQITSQQGNDVQFSVTNYSASDIYINSFKAVYSTSPIAFYHTLIVGDTTVSLVLPVANDDGVGGSGEDFAVNPVVIVGGGEGATDTIPIRIQSPITEADDILPVATLGRGEMIQIDMKGFKTSSNNSVDMTGVPIEIEFSDGSIIRFTPM